MMQLPIKWLIFTSCHITEEVAQVFVDLLKKADHTFCDIKLFKTKPYKWNGFWRNDHDRWDNYTWSWKKILGEIDLLTWSN